MGVDVEHGDEHLYNNRDHGCNGHVGRHSPYSSPRGGGVDFNNYTPRGPRILPFREDARVGEMVQYHGRSGRRDQQQRYEPAAQYWKTGISYAPEKGNADVYRTVVVDNLPLGTKLEQILKYANDYPLVSSQLLDTSKMKLGKSKYWSALFGYYLFRSATLFMRGASIFEL